MPWKVALCYGDRYRWDSFMCNTYGRYCLLEQLGQGGMAEVFKAKSFGVEGFEKTLVIKRILPALAKDQRFIDMFVHEAKLAVRLSHVNVVQTFDLGKVPSEQPHDPPSYFIAMEYVAGLDLSRLLSWYHRREEPVPVALGVFLVSEVAKGLAHAHRRKDDEGNPLHIVHRDVSPQNILLSWEGEVKVADFGIARARSLLVHQPGDQRSRALAGKAAYMSPEQSRGDDLDSRSDIFSLGVVLYELLAGTNPLRHQSREDTLKAVDQAAFPPLHQLRTEVDRDLSAIVHKALARDPDERYQLCGDLYDDLLAYTYTSDARFAAHDLRKLLGPLRDAEPDSRPDLAVSDTTASGTSGASTPDVTVLESAGSPSESTGPVRVQTKLPVRTYASTLGEKRDVALLFTDLDAVSSEQRQEVGERLTKSMIRYGGQVVLVEDGQLATIIGLDGADGRVVLSAVRCARVMLRQLAGFSTAPRVAVHVGDVLLKAGALQRDEHLDSLIQVGRQLASLDEFGCIVSTEAVDRLREPMLLQPVLSVRARADIQPRAYVVRGAQNATDAMRRFVGRDQEVRLMSKVLGRAVHRHLQIVTVRGEQGIGKTRFLKTVQRKIKRQGHNVGMYVASCPPRGKELPLSGISAMLRKLCGVEEGELESRMSEVVPRLRSLGLTDSERSAVLGQLSASPVDESSPRLPRLRAAFTRMLHKLSEDRLHAFVWDDAQSMDEESMDVISSAVRRLTNARAIIVLSTRSFEEHELSTDKNHTTIELRQLDEPAIERFVGARLGLARPPKMILDFCRKRAGGNPLFLEELVRELLETEAIVVRDGTIESIDLTGAVDTPRPLRVLLAARVARLPSEEKAVLHAAAVLGTPIDEVVLATILSMEVSELDDRIVNLERKAILRRSGTATLSFVSRGMREAVLNSIAPDSLERLHGAAAGAYEMTYGTRHPQLEERIAMHWAAGGHPERAATLLVKVAREKLRSGQPEACVKSFVRALSWMDLNNQRPDDLIAWLADLRDAVHVVRAADGLAPLVTPLLKRLDTVGDVTAQTRGRVLLGAMLGAIHLFDRALELLEDAQAEAFQHPGLLAKVYITQGQVFAWMGNSREAVRAYERVEDLSALEAKDRYHYQMGIAIALGVSGESDRAHEALDEAASLAAQHSYGGEVEREKLQALISHFKGDFLQASQATKRCYDLAIAKNLNYEAALQQHNLGDSLIWLKDYPHAYAAFQKSIGMCEQFGFERLALHDRIYLAYLDGLRDSDERPVRQLEELTAEVRRLGYTWDAMNGTFLLASLLFQRGDRDRAGPALTAALREAKNNDSHLLVTSCQDMLRQLGYAVSE